MAIIKVFGFVPDPEQALKDMEIIPEDCFIWTDVCVRTEDIQDFYKKTASKTMINFYDERPSMLVKETFDSLYDRVYELEKEKEEEPAEE